MNSLLPAALLCLGLACQAQTNAPAAPAAPTAAASATAASVPAEDPVPQRGGEPKVQRTVQEDDQVRIEELRVRGITRKVTVQPKLPGVPAYQIGPNSDGRDAAQAQRNEGRALWQLFAF